MEPNCYCADIMGFNNSGRIWGLRGDRITLWHVARQGPQACPYFTHCDLKIHKGQLST